MEQKKEKGAEKPKRQWDEVTRKTTIDNDPSCQLHGFLTS